MSALAYFADSSRTFPEVREVPIVLQKSPWRSSRIKIRNNRIGANRFLNQPCALIPDLESIMRARMRKIVLQHNRHIALVRCAHETCVSSRALTYGARCINTERPRL